MNESCWFWFTMAVKKEKEMIKGLLINDLKKNRAVNIVLCLFIALASMMVASGVSIIAETTGAMDSFFDKAEPIHYMQMIPGEVDDGEISKFASEQGNVKAHQVLEQVGVDNSNLYYGDAKEADAASIMENSFTLQSPVFDFLLDENNEICQVQEGEVALPVYTMETYGLKVGDKLRIQREGFEMEFVIAHQIKDSQMNASLASSKRFLVSEPDYRKIKKEYGQVESLVEFQLKDLSKMSSFEKDYNDSGLPNALAITYTIVQLMNALTLGMTVLILLFLSVLLLVIAAVCLRYTILATLEEEFRDIGMLKAIGMSYKEIRKLYRSKYVILAGVSCVLGILLALVFSQQFTGSIMLYMGSGISIWQKLLFSFLSGAAVFGVVFLMCTLFLRRIRKITPVDAIRGMDTGGKQKSAARLSIQKKIFPSFNFQLGVRDVFIRFKTYFILFFIFVMTAFLLIVPVNLLTTISDASFAKYMGVGDSDVLVTLRYTEDIAERYEKILTDFDNDAEIADFYSEVTGAYKVKNADGDFDTMNIAVGDAERIKLDYLSGRGPKKENEVVLSQLNADALEKEAGDKLELQTSAGVKELSIVGIYQDIANGGKTAKGIFTAEPESIVWYSVNGKAVPGADIDSLVNKYGKAYYPAKAANIEEYMEQTFGETIRQVRTITIACGVIAAIIIVLITALFFKLLLAKDKRELMIQKGLGFNSTVLQHRYMISASIMLIAGVVCGIILSVVLGETLAGMMLGSMGAANISFVISPLLVFILCPLLLIAVEAVTLVFATRGIQKLDNYFVTD